MNPRLGLIVAGGALLTASLLHAAPADPPAVLAVSEYHREAGMLLGGFRDGKWVEQGKLALGLAVGEKYRLYSLRGPAGEATGGKPEGGEPLPDQMFVSLQPAPPGNGSLVAVRGEWNAMPRPVAVQSTDQKVYRDALAAYLRSRGLQRPKLRVTQVLRVDLEGDGREEVILSATPPDFATANAKRDDYTVVLLRKVVNGQVRTLLVDGKFFSRNAGMMSGANRVWVIGVLDLNGDGLLEIVTSWQGYEENGNDVFTLKGGKPVRVLTAGIGA